jgi:hypothetical protein
MPCFDLTPLYTLIKLKVSKRIVPLAFNIVFHCYSKSKWKSVLVSKKDNLLLYEKKGHLPISKYWNNAMMKYCNTFITFWYLHSDSYVIQKCYLLEAMLWLSYIIVECIFKKKIIMFVEFRLFEEIIKNIINIWTYRNMLII